MKTSNNSATTEKTGVLRFLRAIPEMTKAVWSGAWAVMLGITVAVYLSDPGLQFLTLDEWLTSHILIILGLLALTLVFYNCLERMTAAMATLAAWLIAAGLCYFAEAALRVAGA